MEAAGMGFPALAMSLEAHPRYHLSYSEEIDFSVAAHFTAYFARLLLEKGPFAGVDLLKVDVPSEATIETPWQMTRLARQGYYEPLKPERDSWGVPGLVGYRQTEALDDGPDSDVYVMRRKGLISVTPLTLDMTARVDLEDFEGLLRE
jgi:5'-nucleotidase